MWNDGVNAAGELLPGYGYWFDEMLISMSWQDTLESQTRWSLNASSVVLLLLTMSAMFRPVLSDVADCVGSWDFREAMETDSMYMLLHELAEKAGVGRVRLFVAPVAGINAFAMAKPFGSAIVISETVKALPQPYLAWILAHELGHIKRLDTFPQLLWMQTNRLAIWMLKARWYLLRFIDPALRAVPVIRLLSYPVEMLFIVMCHATQIALALARRAFLLGDRFLMRQAEFAADRFACRLVGKDAGIEVLSVLGQTPHTGLLATHPPVEKRIKKIRRLRCESS